MGDERKRTSNFNHMKRLLTRVKQHPGVPLTFDTANTLLERLEKMFLECETLQHNLVELCVDDAAVGVQEVAFEPIETTFIEVKSLLKGIVREQAPPPQASGTSTVGSLNIKLPPIELPQFNGNFADWPSFKDLFLATVDSNPHLAPAQKLQYLKTALQDEPANLVKSLTITDAHYREALSILKERYDNKREIVSSLITKLLTFKHSTFESVSDLQKLIDCSSECLRALKVLGEPVDQWDSLLVVLHTRKLDPTTRREWAIRQTGTAMPTFKEFQVFVTTHIRGLLATGASINPMITTTKKQHNERRINSHHVAAEANCIICKGQHLHYQCGEFLAKSPKDRSTLAMRHQLCFNCLNRDHRISSCKSKSRCRKCKKAHHTLLHDDERRPPTHPVEQPVSTNGPAPPHNGNVSSHHAMMGRRALLSTAVVRARDSQGVFHHLRVFLDGGSEGTLITEECVNRLGLRRQWGRVTVSGVGGAVTGTTKGIVRLTLVHRSDHHACTTIEAHVMNDVTGQLPRQKMKVEDWAHLRGIELADPNWYQPGAVDVLVGAEYFNNILRPGLRLGEEDTPVAQNTLFGWMLCGKVAVDHTMIRTFHVTTELDSSIRRFWEIEEPPRVRTVTKEEKLCETHFIDNLSRRPNGNFIVGIPFNNKKADLGGSRNIAMRRLHQVERRLRRQPNHREQYLSFMKEYESLGHMEKIPPGQSFEEIGRTNYLPHHFVVNESSTSTKLRVVFDGSAPTTTGTSLNDTLMVGATLQEELYDILIRFRLYPIILKADISKMFRQFYLKKEDTEFHRILWRDSPDQPIEDYRLLTVTYGTACAPFLATRCVVQLATEVSDKYPLASKVLSRSCYVDDVLGGEDNVKSAIVLYKQLSLAVSEAGLQLRKWSSNNAEVLAAIPEEERESTLLSFDQDETVKALGIQWCPNTDNFTFKYIDMSNDNLTKRVLLSDLSKVFDPLGLVSCVTIRAKLLLQELWRVKVDWDEAVPNEIQQQWISYRDDLKLIPSLKIPRRITTSDSATIELHGFSDSSERAYGAIVYLRSVSPSGTVTVNFITSKTKVAPLRQVTLPRLELISAVLLAELITRVRESLDLKCDVFCWSDSTITLKWIASHPRRWHTFVANRVANIQELTPVECWRHVPGLDNPADLASRGVSVQEIIDNSFWWRGPAWLSSPNIPLMTVPQLQHENLEERAPRVMVHHLLVNTSILERFSSINRLKRVTARILRLFYNAKTENRQQNLSGPLKVFELQNALDLWIRITQQQCFTTEVHCLKTQKPLPSKSKLLPLYPFIDSSGIMRVGGRLVNASLPESQKHQIILPHSSHLTFIIIDDCHQTTFHGGFQLTWATIQSTYWVLSGRDKVRHFVRSCIRCRRLRARVTEQLMGNLPEPRVTPARPFLSVGVDYAGPFLLKNPIGRISKTYKGYMCLFVCFVTKAVHLEAVSSLSTEAFLEALRRFVSRRGLCSHIYSDQGTNFIGCEKELKKMIISRDHQTRVTDECTTRGIQFHFNPPSSPHHGGLWEAGVKSAKHHLRRVVGNRALTFEQFFTFLCQVEAILNSRPLYGMSSDATDLQPLTPGHFLTGEPLLAIPDADLRDLKPGRLNLFQQQQQRLQHFWDRWYKEYLNTLQQRNKWRWQRNNVQVGDLILLKEETNVQDWRLGRVVELHSGADGNTRVVTLKTKNGNLQRPIVKCIPLISQNSS